MSWNLLTASKKQEKHVRQVVLGRVDCDVSGFASFA